MSDISDQQAAGRTEPPVFMFPALRTRALEGVDASGGRLPKVLAVVAPVGYGKTVLMSTLLADLRRVGKHCVWFALDERDTAALHLISAIEALLHGEQAAVHPMQALFRGPAPMETRMDELVARLNAHPVPLILFIDNLNCCTDPALGPLLDRLVFHTAPTVQWVFSSTRELPLDVSRAQLQGLFRQLGSAELSFNPEEVRQLLGAELAGRVGPQGVAQVARETEGWPAAVRMAQIILAGAEHPPEALRVFSGSDETLAHLLNRQVLSGFPPEVRDFLFRIAQLRSFCRELCQDVSGSPQAGEHLAYLMDRNVFVIPLDRNRRWYRLHGLFREFLLREAEQALTDEQRQEVLVRAARWCERQGVWREAVDYALQSGCADTTREILEHIAAPFVRDRGHVQEYVEWLEKLHAQGHQALPEAEYWFVWALAFHRRYGYARQQCDKLLARLQAEPDGPERNDLARRIAILGISIDSLSDRMEDAHQGAAAWLAHPAVSRDDPFDVTAAHCIETHYYTNAFRFVEARQCIQAARESAYQAQSAHVDGWVAAYAALIAIHEGSYASAYPELVEALAASRAKLGDDTGICGTQALVAARCAVEMGLDEEALQLFEFGIKSSRAHGFLEAASCGIEAAVKLWRGTPDDRISLAQLRDVAACYPPRLSLMMACFLVQRLLVLGRLEEAREEAERAGLGNGSHPPLGRLGELQGMARLESLLAATRIELLMAGGHYKPAEALIATEAKRAKDTHCMAHNVLLALCQADIAVRNSDLAQAARHLTRAITWAAPRSIVRPFTDRAAIMAAVVADTKPSAWGFATAEERRFFADRCRHLSFADPTLTDRLATLSDDRPVLLAPLTSRETELLGYIDAGLTNQQIADRIEVSATTVKWHLQNLFAKLSVTSRSAALARARVLNLLAR